MTEATGQAISVGAVVGARLRGLREERAWLRRQDDVAARVREVVGLEWTQATVAAIESGRRNVTVEELVALSVACDVRLPEWFEGDGQVEIAPGSTISYRGMRSLLGSSESIDAAQDFDFVGQRDERRERLASAIAQGAEARRRALLPKFEPLRDPLQVGMDSRREAEQKAAAKFAMEPLDVAVLAHSLWGRGLTDERERRVQERTPELPSAQPVPDRRLQAIRGHVTRELLDEFIELAERVGVITTPEREGDK